MRYTGPSGLSIQQVCTPGPRRVGKHIALHTLLWNVGLTRQIRMQTISGADEILLRLLSRVYRTRSVAFCRRIALYVRVRYYFILHGNAKHQMDSVFETFGEKNYNNKTFTKK